MSQLTDLYGRGVFARIPACADKPWCEGHVDSTATAHGTEYEFFGPDGVVVTQIEGQPPLVALIEIETPQHDMTPTRARLEAYRLLMAADFAERAGLPTVTDQLVRQLAEALNPIPQH